MHSIEYIRERARMHGERGHILPSETLNQLSECEQSEYERIYDLLDYGAGCSPFAECEYVAKDYCAGLALR